MSEKPLAEVIATAVAEHYGAGDNAAMMTSFIFVGELMTVDEGVTVVVAHPETQSFVQSIGLSTLADEWIRDDMRSAFAGSLFVAGDEDDD